MVGQDRFVIDVPLDPLKNLRLPAPTAEAEAEVVHVEEVSPEQ